MSSSPSSASTTTPTALHHHNHLNHHNKPANQSSPTKNKLNGASVGVVNPSSLDVENTNSVEDRANKRMRMSDSIDNMNNLTNNTNSNGTFEPMESTCEVSCSNNKKHTFKGRLMFKIFCYVEIINEFLFLL
jgi:hypothetical protein